MAMQTLSPDQLDLTSSRKTLILVWQNPTTRRFVKVGQVDALPGGRVAFQYLESAFDDPDFLPLLEYPNRDTAYLSDEVPAFFSNRILSTDRPSYGRYLDWLGLDQLKPEDVPFEVLARTGGGRATDTFHVVDLPLDRDHNFSSRFFVSGIRHAKVSGEVLESIQNGDRLHLQLEDDNLANPKAVLVNSADNRKLGYVPNWLCSDVHERIKNHWDVTAIAERVNPDAPSHVQVLCRIEARRS